jgi:hypothetical protein
MWKPGALAGGLWSRLRGARVRRHRKWSNGKDKLVDLELDAHAEVRGRQQLFVCDVEAQNGSHMSSCASALSVHSPMLSHCNIPEGILSCVAEEARYKSLDIFARKSSYYDLLNLYNAIA